MTSPPISPGSMLAGKYRVEHVLGRGAMGIVVQAHHLELDEPVAIKLLLPHSLSSPEAVARFEREARAAVKIKSEHVARVSDVGHLEGGLPYMVMELLRGADLGEVLLKSGPLSLPDAADYLLQACEAIAEAHKLGIVHRDLKPSNLFLTKRPDGAASVKVLDFGISKATTPMGSSPSHTMTQTSAAMGSPLYMSPEQLASARDVDMRADIWALGVVLFEFLTGRQPFAGDTLPQLCAAIISRPPIPIRSLRPDLPDGVERLIADCLEKERVARVANVAEFATRLVEFAPQRSRLSAERIVGLSLGAGLSATTAELPHARDDAPHHQTVAEFGGTSSASSSGKKKLASASIIVALLGVAVFLLMRPRAMRATPTASVSSLPAPPDRPVAKAVAVVPPSADLPTPLSSSTSSASAPTPEAPTPEAPTPEALAPLTKRPELRPPTVVAQKREAKPAAAPALAPKPAPSTPKLEPKTPAPVGPSLGGRL